MAVPTRQGQRSIREPATAMFNTYRPHTASHGGTPAGMTGRPAADNHEHDDEVEPEVPQ